MGPGELADFLKQHRKVPDAGATGAKRARRASEGEPPSVNPPPGLPMAEECPHSEPPADVLPAGVPLEGVPSAGVFSEGVLSAGISHLTFEKRENPSSACVSCAQSQEVQNHSNFVASSAARL